MWCIQRGNTQLQKQTNRQIEQVDRESVLGHSNKLVEINMCVVNNHIIDSTWDEAYGCSTDHVFFNSADRLLRHWVTLNTTEGNLGLDTKSSLHTYY